MPKPKLPNLNVRSEFHAREYRYAQMGCERYVLRIFFVLLTFPYGKAIPVVVVDSVLTTVSFFLLSQVTIGMKRAKRRMCPLLLPESYIMGIALHCNGFGIPEDIQFRFFFSKTFYSAGATRGEYIYPNDWTLASNALVKQTLP